MDVMDKMDEKINSGRATSIVGKKNSYYELVSFNPI